MYSITTQLYLISREEKESRHQPSSSGCNKAFYHAYNCLGELCAQKQHDWLNSVGEQAGLIPATCSWDDNVCVRYVNPVLANQHVVFFGFVVLGRGSWVFFFCVVSSHL